MSRLTVLIKGSSMQDAEVLMGAPILADGTFLLNDNHMEVPLELIKSFFITLASQRVSTMTSQIWVAEKITSI
jgi:hypothetical protein